MECTIYLFQIDSQNRVLNIERMLRLEIWQMNGERTVMFAITLVGFVAFDFSLGSDDFRELVYLNSVRRITDESYVHDIE